MQKRNAQNLAKVPTEMFRITNDLAMLFESMGIKFDLHYSKKNKQVYIYLKGNDYCYSEFTVRSNGNVDTNIFFDAPSACSDNDWMMDEMSEEEFDEYLAFLEERKQEDKEEEEFLKQFNVTDVSPELALIIARRWVENLIAWDGKK